MKSKSLQTPILAFILYAFASILVISSAIILATQTEFDIKKTYIIAVGIFSALVLVGLGQVVVFISRISYAASEIHTKLTNPDDENRYWTERHLKSIDQSIVLLCEIAKKHDENSSDIKQKQA